jgi:hypothetical protein
MHRLMLATLLLAAPARAQTAPAPHVVSNDRWLYQSTTENASGWHQLLTESVVASVKGRMLVLAEKQPNTPIPARSREFGTDWSLWHEHDGNRILINQPFAFPISPGKTWAVDYTEENPNLAHRQERFHLAYTATGWEDVTTPGGIFHALKIECRGEWHAVTAPRGADQGGREVGGTIVKSFWYVPAVKRAVKAIEEYDDDANALVARYTDELISYKVIP